MKRRLAVALNMLAPYWHEIFEELSRSDWDVSIFVATEKEKDRNYQKPNYSDYTFLVEKSYNVSVDLSRFGFKTHFLHLQMGLWKNLKEYKPDVILSNDLGLRTILSLFYGKLHHVPVVPWICVSSHTERNNSHVRESIRRYILKNVPCVCTNLTEAKKYLINSLRIPPANIYTTPYAVNVCTFQSHVQEQRRHKYRLKIKLGLRGKVFLYVGQMVERKGLRQMVESLMKLSDEYNERYSLLFVGGALPHDLMNLLKLKNICFTNIHFVQPNNLHQFYSIADAFIFPSLEDEWGIVLNEAAASGLPLISSIYAAATTDLVKDGINGFKYDPLNIQQLAVILETFLNMSKRKQKSIGAASVEIVKQLDVRFTIYQMKLALQRANQECVDH